MSSYFRKGQRLIDGKEFIKQLKTDGTEFGNTADEIKEAETAYTAFAGDFEKGISIDAQKQEQTKRTKQTDSDFTAHWRKIAKRMKASEKYSQTKGVGERYKIVGDENSIDIDKAQPKLTVKKVEAGWEFSFNLHGFFDGVKIFRQRPGEPKKFMAVDTSSPYIDTEPFKNGTQYTAWYLMGDETVGLESDILEVGIKEE